MSVEKLELDYIETPDDSVTFAEAQQDVVVDTKKNLDDLRNDIQHPEIYGTSDEQYYFLGQTNVKDGDIRDVTDAIEFRDKLSDAKITISGGADQLFMSEVKGQQVLDGEIAKLQTLKASFSGANVAMIEQLIAELNNPTNHNNIAAKYPRADKKSNLGNARLIAARIASGYTEVLTTIATKIKETGHDTTFSYDIPWELCVIGTSGDKLFDRKINVHITITSDAVPVNNGPKPTDKPPVNPSDQPPTPTDEEPTNIDEEPTDTDQEDPTNIDVVDAVPLVIVHSMIADVLNPKNKLVFWDGTYTYDHTTRSKLPNGDMVVSIKDKASGKVVLDVGYTKDGVPYIGLDGYKHIVATDATQASIDGFVDFVAIHMMAADTPKFELLLSKVAEGKNAQNPAPSIEEPIQQDDGELEIEGSNKFTEAFSLSAVEVNNQKTESGKLLTLLPGTNTDFLSAAAKPTLFTKDAKGNCFPNIEAIQEYYDDNGLQVEFIMAGPTYEDGTTITGLAKDIYTDKDGKQKISHVGSSIDFSGKAASMGLLLIEDGKMSLHHTLDKPTPTIPKDAEAITLSSVKRPDPDKPGSYKILTSNVEKYKYGHRIVEDKNGNISILMLKDMSNEDKIALVNDDTYKRILYCDVLGNNAHLDAYWSRDDDAMTYSYHGAADVLWDGTGGASEVRGNMPGLLVVSVPKKKNTPTPVINTIQNIGPTVIPPKEEPIQQDPILQEPVLTSEEPKKTITLDIHNPLLLAILASGVTIDSLKLTLGKIKDSSLRSEIEKYLIAGKSKEAMQLVGMHEKSIFPSNKIPSDGKITKDILKNFEKPNRYLWDYVKILDPKNTQQLSNEFYNTGLLPQAVKDAYLAFAWNDLMKLGETEKSLKQKFGDWIKKPEKLMDTAGKTYAVLSKEDAQVYLFSKDHKLVSKKSVLLGADSHIDAFGMRNGRMEALISGQWHPVKNPDGSINPIMNLYSNKSIQSTVAGLFEAHFFKRNTPAGLSYAMEITPPLVLDDKGQVVLDENGNPVKNEWWYPEQAFVWQRTPDGGWARGSKGINISFHETYKPAESIRAPLYQSENIRDKMISNGCVNVSTPHLSELWDHFTVGSKIFITNYKTSSIVS